jgi:2-hydroxy-4-carboxymuconate semialdehyde hemiacetal dehydrogenase
MPIKVAFVGYGAVGAVHAAQLALEPTVELTAVYGPRQDKASAFASNYGIKSVGKTLADAISGAEAAIVCSPSSQHYRQARECLEMGVSTLVELPPCEKVEEAKELRTLAERQGVVLMCAHTSLYLAPYESLTKSIRSGELGEIQGINYIRHHILRERSWADNALLHHAAHPLDLLLSWFGEVTPKACVAVPRIEAAQTVSCLGELPSGAPASVSVTYASRLPRTVMVVVGEDHTVETAGFSYIRSDLESLRLDSDEKATYERAIHDQDMEFLRACRGEWTGVGWDETVSLMETIQAFQEIGRDDKP